MDSRTNTIAGWVLGAAAVALGASIGTGEVFKHERPEKMGYPIEGVEVESDGAAAEQPIETFLASADPAAGEQVFKKCAACHNATRGGGNGLGPNLWGALGKPHGHVPGFAYSDALKSKPGVWDWTSMSEWLTSPRNYAPGTKMTFAGLSKPEDRANIIAYLNQQSDAPLPLPAAPAADTPAEAAAEASDTGTEPPPGKAEDEPVVTEADAVNQPGGRVKGDAAPAQ